MRGEGEGKGEGYGEGEERVAHHEAPEVDEEEVAAPEHDLDHAGQDRSLNSRIYETICFYFLFQDLFVHLDELGDEELLYLVEGEEAGGLLVEPVALLHHEGAGEGGGRGE